LTRRLTIAPAAIGGAIAALLAGSPRPAAAQGQVPVQERRAQAAPSLKAAAPVDLTGDWVSVVSEDWRWRMLTPENAEGRKVGDNWDPSKDEAAGNQCKAYGVGGVMRLPGRLHITWQDDNTLKIETDAGQQTRLLHFGAPLVKGAGTWQGLSAAVWEVPAGRGGGAGGEVAEAGAGGRGGGAPLRGGQLKVITTRMRAGYLRKNGAPYSDHAVITEYFIATKEENGAQWLVVTTTVDDPEYLTQPFITSTHFKKEPDNSKWSPTPCSAR
jgi:hypothetical protein